MDHGKSIFWVFDRRQSGQPDEALGFISLEQNFSKATPLGIAYHLEHRAYHQLQPSLSGMSFGLEVVHPTNWDASSGFVPKGDRSGGRSSNLAAFVFSGRAVSSSSIFGPGEVCESAENLHFHFYQCALLVRKSRS